MMSPDYISYETLVAAREAADWACWSMAGTWVSALATLFAAIIAAVAIRGWRKHEEANELKEFRVAAYGYHTSLIRAPYQNCSNLSQEDDLAVQQTYFMLQEFYVACVRMHSKSTRGKAATIYLKMADVQTRYTSGEINKEEAIEEVTHIRNHEPLLGIGLKRPAKGVSQ
ncbi:hypothetical protein [Klebsiella aerogenes]|uniref:hypothetical protein n=1 Tax=Klebsiella aerogenes TaxID=548 RepID=UPI00280DEFDC|nr:hypothetical protein [Klebsiella aerogenes]MDQ8572779.1 hypothetical protein [Klebsiella aerogenes]